MFEIVDAKLNSFCLECQSANAAIDTFMRACNLRSAASPKHHMHYFPLLQAGIRLKRALTDQSAKYRHTDAQHFQQFTDAVPIWQEKSADREEGIAMLWLHHPTTPSPQPALEFYRQSFDVTTHYWRDLLSHFLKTRPLNKTQIAFSNRMRRTLFLLKQAGRESEVTWLAERIRESFPEHAEDLYRGFADMESNSSSTSSDRTGPVPLERVPFPTFA